MKRTALIFALVCGAILTLGSQAHASILGGVLTSGLNQINDINREYLEKKAGSTTAANILDVGDTLEAILLFDNITNASGNFDIVDVPNLSGLTAYSRITVTSKTLIFGSTYAFTFAGGFGDGLTAVKVFETSSLAATTDFNTLLTRPAAITAATNGTPLFTLTLGGTGDFWQAIGTDNLFLVSTGNPVNFNFGLSVGTNPANVPIVLDGVLGANGDMHDVRGSGQVFNLPDANFANGWQAASNTQVEFLAAPVPEASSVAVWVALSVAGAFGLSKVKKS